MTIKDTSVLAAMDGYDDVDAWTEALFLRELELPFSRTLVAVSVDDKGERICGFITFWLVSSEVQLHKIFVEESCRRHGIGRLMLQAMTDQAAVRGISSAVLEVRQGNEAALGLYESCGYRITSARKGYYGRDGRDALVMCAELR